MHDSDCFRMLAVALGIETETLALKLRGYSIRKLEIFPSIAIKAEFLHVRYDIKTRTDVIRTDIVSLVWEPGEGNTWVQLGCIRREIENRTHFKTDAGFENAVTAVFAEHLNGVLGGQSGQDLNTGVLGYARTGSNQGAYEVCAEEKSPASAISNGAEKNPNGAKSRKIKKPRHGRGRR